MPFEMWRTVPHLKALKCSIECVSWHGCGITFKQRYTVLKSTILLHKRAKRRIHVTVAAYLIVIMTKVNVVGMSICLTVLNVFAKIQRIQKSEVSVIINKTEKVFSHRDMMMN